jgi:TetR/AcrR family transcriptional repressor of nem operon
LSTLVGALSIARAVNNKKLSLEILNSAADELKAQLG